MPKVRNIHCEYGYKRNAVTDCCLRILQSQEAPILTPVISGFSRTNENATAWCSSRPAASATVGPSH
ncbi:hypothetical protein L873DRAFT_1803533 [Choiromyces venosus 120613-1]|uniref:Uncharacterized protein n=1 Tax=Choiromyces venosus 120613-1 TaxID=1336337 RepID=A0A3N4JZW3_9PEZI|nr:hypothetical protein L873DRAFT_1803533 [Choiromyces venosus 120613-1]